MPERLARRTQTDSPGARRSIVRAAGGRGARAVDGGVLRRRRRRRDPAAAAADGARRPRRRAQDDESGVDYAGGRERAGRIGAGLASVDAEAARGVRASCRSADRNRHSRPRRSRDRSGCHLAARPAWLYQPPPRPRRARPLVDVRSRFGTRSELVRSTFGTRSEPVRSTFGVRSGCVRSALGVGSECVRSTFGVGSERVRSPSPWAVLSLHRPSLTHW